MRVRRARKEDFVEIHKLILEIFPNARARIEAGDEFFVAEENKLVGFAHFCEDNKKIVLKGLGVRALNRNKGIGEKLVDEVITHAKKAGKKIYLKTKVDNPALKLYYRKGFCLLKAKENKLVLVMRMHN